MATTGDVFRSYQPSGGGRDVHLFISQGGTVPHTAKQYGEGRQDLCTYGAREWVQSALLTTLGPSSSLFFSDNFRSPQYKPPAVAQSNTNPPARYLSDGSGRDGYMG